MKSDNGLKPVSSLLPGSWRSDEVAFAGSAPRNLFQPSGAATPAGDQLTSVLQLLGQINYKILSGNTLYVEVNGTAYKVLYGAYWRSVFNGAEHYLLKCEEIARGMWIDGDERPSEVELAIGFTSEGWLVKGHSLNFMTASE